MKNSIRVMTADKPVASKAASMMIAAGGIVGAINDLVNPLAAIAEWTVIVCAVFLALATACLASQVLRRIICSIPTPDALKEFVRAYWAAPLMLGLLLLGVSVTAMAHFTKRSASEGGVLAATFPAVAEWKSELGLINSKLSQIEKASNRTADASESIDRKAENFKKEVSGNPQKELANMGVPWTDEGFGQALLRNDVKVVSLYLAGGWNVTSNFGEGNAIGHFVGRGSMVEINSVEKIIDMLLEHGLSINEPVFRFRGLQATDIATAAAGGCNYQMLKIALSRGANRKNAVTAAKGYMQAPRDSPFHHECEENRKKIFKLLGIPESYQGGYITVN